MLPYQWDAPCYRVLSSCQHQFVWNSALLMRPTASLCSTAVTDPQLKIAAVLGTGSLLGMVGMPLVGVSSSSDCFLVHHIVKQQVAISFLSSHKERFWLFSVFNGIFYLLKLSRADIPQCTVAIEISILETNMFKEF